MQAITSPEFGIPGRFVDRRNTPLRSNDALGYVCARKPLETLHLISSLGSANHFNRLANHFRVASGAYLFFAYYSFDEFCVDRADLHVRYHFARNWLPSNRNLYAAAKSKIQLVIARAG